MSDFSRPFKNAVWVTPDKTVASPIIRKNFFIENPKKDAYIYLTGLGYFEATINGVPLCEDKLIPPASDYFRRNFSNATYPVRDFFTHRIYYHRLDIGELLKSGENTLEIWLGGGWFVQKERIAEGEMSYSDNCTCIFEIHSGDECIRSDGTETWTESTIRYSNIFIGEKIDMGFCDETPKPVQIFEMPETILSPAIGQNDKIIRTITPALIYESDNRCVYDIGENISALISLRVQAHRGETYKIQFSEQINKDMTLSTASTGATVRGKDNRRQIMCDEFICSGKKDFFMPKFVWHAFRYFEITGDCKQSMEAVAHVIHAKADITAEFESDSEGLNFLYDAYIRTQLSNYHGSFPSDCPHRERLGYTGDGQITATAAMMILDTKELYRKWIRDILDGQDKITGHIQHTAPFQGGGGGPGGWCSAVITVPYAFAKEYGYDKILDDALPAMKRWIDFTFGCMESGLIVRESDGGWCLGDWCAPEGKELPETFVNTCWFIHSLRLYRELSHFLGNSPEENLKVKENECINAVRKEYQSIRNIGSAMAYAAWIGIEDTSRVAKFYENATAFDTGFLGTDVLCEVLFREGYGNIAIRLLNSEEKCSFLYMKNRGSTTLWELWHGNKGSWSHPMFGGCVRQLFQGLLGISQPYGSFGYEKVTVNPFLPDNINYAKGRILTVRGEVSVSLERTSCGIKTNVHKFN